MGDFDFSNREMVIQRLKELKESNVPKMTLDKLIETQSGAFLKCYIENATEEEIKECNEYLSKYCENGYNENKDIFSNEKCVFYWALKHGEMTTDDNGLNRTYYHYLTLGRRKHRVEIMLQYHPDCYEIEESEEI